jgi:hypothetical protein
VILGCEERQLPMDDDSSKCPLSATSIAGRKIENGRELMVSELPGNAGYITGWTSMFRESSSMRSNIIDLENAVKSYYQGENKKDQSDDGGKAP